MDPLAIALVAAGAVLLLICSLWLRRRVSSRVMWAALAFGSLLCGAGMLVALDSTRAVNWVVVLLGLGVLGPIHFRALLGPFGPPAPVSSATVVRS